MADYGCHPLWLSGEEVGDVSPEDPALALPSDLAERLHEWAAEFDRTLNREDPRLSGFPSEDAERRFVQAGEALARQVAKQLGPAWAVRYFDLRVNADRTVPYS
ncbi:hypothetical protein [Streptomyces sp. NPDC019224]|uniref:hypothetical protein n=1 Tax=Streptomyces sp. NPDC019224 TaxID=3154484 RepID=UPI0033DC34AE